MGTADTGVLREHDRGPILDRAPRANPSVQAARATYLTMPRPQFTFRALLVAVAVSAVGAWLVKLMGPTIALVTGALACLPLAGPLFRRPLEGILAMTFLFIVAFWAGIAVFAIAMGD
jgi:hypothetical protein